MTNHFAPAVIADGASMCHVNSTIEQEAPPESPIRLAPITCNPNTAILRVASLSSSIHLTAAATNTAGAAASPRMSDEIDQGALLMSTITNKDLEVNLDNLAGQRDVLLSVSGAVSPSVREVEALTGKTNGSRNGRIGNESRRNRVARKVKIRANIYRRLNRNGRYVSQ